MIREVEHVRIAVPNSANELAPVHPSNPDASHTIRLAPTLCVFAATTPGEELDPHLSVSHR